MTIRCASENDIEALNKISDAGGDVKSPDYFARCLEEQTKKLREVLIVENGGALAGFAMYQRHPQYQPFRSLNIPEIQDLRIHRDFQRNGHATALIDHCCIMAKGEGHDLIGLGVGLDSSYGKAQRLYFKLGFEPDGGGIVYERKAVIPGRAYNIDDELCLMMIKKLE